MLSSEQITQFVNATTTVVTNAMTNVISNVVTIATSSSRLNYNNNNNSSSSYYYGGHRSSSSSSNSNDTSSLVISIISYGIITFTSSLLLLQYTTSANPIGRCILFLKQLHRQEKSLTSSNNVNDGITEYSKLHSTDVDTNTRLASYQQLVNAYYDLATVFYEWGWGHSFHFSYQYSFENFRESIRRHEYVLAAQLLMNNNTCCYGNHNNKHILDVGCGIGGPARNISRFLQCQITGITLNTYQVQRGNELNIRDPYANVTCIQGDFMHLPSEFSNPIPIFDGAYAIEATCHAPDRTACYHEVYKALKPGAVFALYEWCMTSSYDETNPIHLQLKKDIEEGNGLPDICNTQHCLQCMKDAGFTIIYEGDLASSKDIRGYNGNQYFAPIQSWMTPLLPSWNIFSQRFQFNWFGAIITNITIYTMELLHLAPAGTVKTQKVLQTGGFALRDAGTAGIFTTMYMIVGRKPE